MPVAYLKTFDGLKLRYGWWPAAAAPCRGSVLILAGRTEFLEKYHPVINRLGYRGFDVISFDWRGQGLSDRMLADRKKGHVNTYQDYLRDMEQVVSKVLARRGRAPFFLLGHSMGAHVGLMYLRRAASGFEKAVLTSPMVDIVTKPFPEWVARGFGALARWRRLGGHYIPLSRRYEPYSGSFAGNRLTSDRHRFAQIHRIMANEPRLAIGGVTIGWLSATFKAIDQMKRVDFTCPIRTPMLLVRAGADQVVRSQAVAALANRLADSRLLTLDGARHEILQERDDIQSRFWQAFDAFMG